MHYELCIMNYELNKALCINKRLEAKSKKAIPDFRYGFLCSRQVATAVQYYFLIPSSF